MERKIILLDGITKTRFNSMVCYRRKSKANPYFEASENIAGLINYWICTEEELAPIRPVLFEEVVQTKEELRYNENGIKEFMPKVKRVFFVMCPDFFEEILDRYEDQEITSRTDRDSELFRGFINAVANNSIIYNETKYALSGYKEAGRRLYNIPIAVNGVRPLKANAIAKLNVVFGKDFDYIVGLTNPPMLEYSEIKHCFDGKRRWFEMSESERRALVEELERERCIKELKQNFIAHLLERPRDEIDREKFAQKLRADLKSCAATTQANVNPYTGSKHQSFSAEDPRIIYDPIKAYFEPNSPPFPQLAKCLVDSFREKRESLGLASSNLSYWPLDFNLSENSAVRVINTCAICFGSLIINHRLGKDRSVLNEPEAHDPLTRSRRERAEQELASLIDTGVNMLVALRNPYTYTWPSTYEFGVRSLGMDGTLNQTTLSLSTLYSCGFLDPKKCEARGLGTDVVKNRYLFVYESVERLFKYMFETKDYYGDALCSWGYTEENTSPALAPTVFVFDTLLKTLSITNNLLDVFCDNDPVFCKSLRANAERLSETLEGVINYFDTKQCGRAGENYGAFKRSDNDTKYSLTHTAYVLKSLDTYVSAADTRGTEAATLAESIIEKAAAYIESRVGAMCATEGLSFRDDEERFDSFASPKKSDESAPLRSTKGEKFEHCAELIVAEALCKIAAREESPTKRRALTDMIQTLMYRFSSARVEYAKGDTDIRILSCRPEALKHPIYYVYYYRMAILDYLLLLDSEGETDKE